MSSQTSNTSRRYQPAVIAVLADLPIESPNMRAEDLQAEFERFTENVASVFSVRMPDLTEREFADVWVHYLPYEAFLIICDAPPEIRVSRRSMQVIIIEHELNRREQERRANAPPASCTRSRNELNRPTE